MSISSVKVSPYISFTLEGKSPKMFEVYGDGGKLLLTAYRDGGIKSPTRDDMNEAARLFWKLMAQQFHDQIVEGFKQKKETGCSGGLQ